MAKTPSQWELDGTFIEGLSLTVQTEASNKINVVVNGEGVGNFVPAALPKLHGYLSDDSDGSSITATAPTTLAIKTSGRGTLTEHVANAIFTVTLDANGLADVELGSTGTETWYLVIIKPDGTLLKSAAITFA